MNAVADARASQAARQLKVADVLRAKTLFTDQELSLTRLFSRLAHRAQAVVEYLEPLSRRHTLDSELSDILRTAKHTLKVRAKQRFKGHN